MKKIFFITTSFIFLFLSFSLANWTVEVSKYNKPIINNKFDFKAIVKDNTVSMNWNRVDLIYSWSLTYYKVVRSTNNSNPVYPEDWYIKFSTDMDFTSYVDENPKEWINFYRVCAIMQDNNRYCSNVVKINFIYKEINYTSDYNTTYNNPSVEDKNINTNVQDKIDNFKEKEIIKKPKITKLMQVSLDATINKFSLKLQNSWKSIEDQINQINIVISKFEKLKNTKPKLTNAIEYIVEKLTELKTSLEATSEIEDIFNIE